MPHNYIVIKSETLELQNCMKINIKNRKNVILKSRLFFFVCSQLSSKLMIKEKAKYMLACEYKE